MTRDTFKAKRGRPLLSDHEKVKVKNVTMDTEAQTLINLYRAHLIKEFGFLPTISQALKHVLKKALENT